MTTARSLNQFLLAGSPQSLVVVLDVDGTIHRGLPLLNPRGYSNVELAAELILSERFRPLKACAAASTMLAIQAYDFYLLLLIRLGRLSMGQRDCALIQAFVTRILRHYRQDQVCSAAERVTRYAFPEFSDAVRALGLRCHCFLLISKAFQVVAAKYAADIGRVTGREVEAKANGLEWQHGRVGLKQDQAILTRADKSLALEQALQARPALSRVLVIGDSEEDTGMIETARCLCGPENVFAVAVRPKDRAIRSACDLVVQRWQEILDRLQE